MLSKSTGMFTVYWDTNFEMEEDEEDYSKYMNPPLPDEYIANGIVSNSTFLKETDKKLLSIGSSFERERKKHKKSKKSCRKHKGKHVSPDGKIKHVSPEGKSKHISPNRKSKQVSPDGKSKEVSPNWKNNAFGNSVVINIPCDSFIDYTPKHETNAAKLENLQKIPKEYKPGNSCVDNYPIKEHIVKVKVEPNINEECTSTNAKKEHKIKIKTEPIDDYSSKKFKSFNEDKSCSNKTEPIANDHYNSKNVKSFNGEKSWSDRTEPNTANVNVEELWPSSSFPVDIVIKKEPGTTDRDSPVNISDLSNKRSHMDTYADPTIDLPVSSKKPRLNFTDDIVVKQELIDEYAKTDKLYEQTTKFVKHKTKDHSSNRKASTKIDQTDSNYVGTITHDRVSNTVHCRSTKPGKYESKDHFPNRGASHHSDVASVKTEPEDDIKESQSIISRKSPHELKAEPVNVPKKEPLNVPKTEPLNVPKAESFSSIKESNIKVQAPCVPTSIDSVFDMIDFPCVGLDYVFEIQRPSLMHDIVFRCELCNAKCGQKTILLHLKSFKHYLFCLKKYRPLIYQNFRFEKKAKISGFVEACIKDLEREMGRGRMSIKPNLTVVPQSSSDSSYERSPSNSPGLKSSFNFAKNSTYHVPPYEDFRTHSPRPSSSSFSKNAGNYLSSFHEESPNHSPKPESPGFVNRAVSYQQPSHHVKHKSKLVTYEEETSSNSPKPEAFNDSDRKSSSYRGPSHHFKNNKPSYDDSSSYSPQLESSAKKLSSYHVLTNQVKHGSNLVSYESSPSPSPTHEISTGPAKPSSHHSPSRHGKHEVKSSSKHHTLPSVNFNPLSPELDDKAYSFQIRSQVKSSESLPAQSDVTTARICHLNDSKPNTSQSWSREVRSHPVETVREVKSIRIKDSTPPTNNTDDMPDRSMGDYYCRVCDSHMSSDQIWESHRVGKRHRKNVKKPPGEKPSKVKSQKRVDIEPLLLEELEGVDDAIVGLKHISEIIKNDQEVGPTYACYLCSGSFTRMNIITHLISTRHRLQYMQEVDPESYHLTNEVHFSKTALDSFVENKAHELECKYGRGTIEVRTEIIKD